MILRLLDVLLLAPLATIYESVFARLPASLGVAGRIVAFGVLLNVALMPVYRQMEQRSSRGRALKDVVARDVARMKAHFKGRERYFYIRAVYRQHRYHPIQDLLGSSDLVLQVLVFSTVYRFLAAHPALAGASFGPIEDLGRPDGLVGGAHLLPIVMTAVNVASVLAYSESWSRRAQGIGLAALFLWLLYGSPAGLVLYWTANNVFSLLRNLARRHLAPRVAGWDLPSLRALTSQR